MSKLNNNSLSKSNANYKVEFYREDSSTSPPLKGLLQWSLMNVHMTDVLTELRKSPSDLSTIRVHVLNEK